MDSIKEKYALHAGNMQRFVVSGATGTVVHFFFLIIGKEIIGFSIIASTTIAFIIASTVSFLLQKIWTFKNYNTAVIHLQAIRYLCIALINMGINAILMHMLSDRLAIYYLIAQFITSGLIAIESYLLYRFIVFKEA